MAEVKLAIAGRTYDVHCADGQEAQLAQLGAIVDEKARGIQGGTEVRQLLFAALMLADEANEAQTKAHKAEPQSDSLRAAVALAESREASVRDELREALAREKALRAELDSADEHGQASMDRPSHDRALTQIADRIEALAAKVEQMP